jgi:hypothetical protein
LIKLYAALGVGALILGASFLVIHLSKENGALKERERQSNEDTTKRDAIYDSVYSYRDCVNSGGVYSFETNTCAK